MHQSIRTSGSCKKRLLLALDHILLSSTISEPVILRFMRVFLLWRESKSTANINISLPDVLVKIKYLVDLDFYGSVSPYSTKSMVSFVTIMGKKVFEETRKALKSSSNRSRCFVSRYATTHFFHGLLFCGAQIETNHCQKKITTIKGKNITSKIRFCKLPASKVLKWQKILLFP